jgi:hypothetical protein
MPALLALLQERHGPPACFQRNSGSLKEKRPTDGKNPGCSTNRIRERCRESIANKKAARDFNA